MSSTNFPPPISSSGSSGSDDEEDDKNQYYMRMEQFIRSSMTLEENAEFTAMMEKKKNGTISESEWKIYIERVSAPARRRIAQMSKPGRWGAWTYGSRGDGGGSDGGGESGGGGGTLLGGKVFIF